MLNKILASLIIFLFFSCGKDVVIIEDVPVPHEPQEVFEVNILGYSTDSDHNFLEDVDLTINGINQNTDTTSFFVLDNIFVGKEGSVIKAEKLGFLPVFKRGYHHRSLEDVVMNITMYNLPMGQEMTSAGGEIQSDEGAILSFSENSVEETSGITFYSSFNQENRIDFDLFIISNDKVQILEDQAMFHIGSTAELITGSEVLISIDIDKIKSTQNLDLYKYNEVTLTWEVVQSGIIEENNKLRIDITSLGWWALGTSLETIYGSVKINQTEGSATEILPLSDSEVVFTKLDETTINEHLFTNENGQITKYFPVKIPQTVAINNGHNIVVLESEFTTENRNNILQLEEQITHQIFAEVYDCNLIKHSGFVALVSDNQYVIKQIENGNIDVFSNVENEKLEFRFYDLYETLLTTKTLDPENIDGIPINFVACDPILSVETDAVVLQNFDQCKLRVKPIESFIVGESSDENQFFIAFKGDEVGQYDGLVYYTGGNLSFTVADIEKDVKIDIMIYDKISSTVAGFVDGKYKNGSKYNVSFIGNIEE
ncbi:MAG: hypothetical protein ACJATI_003639 [Halioglobus sp.]|jgi:hypothetical protein